MHDLSNKIGGHDFFGDEEISNESKDLASQHCPQMGQSTKNSILECELLKMLHLSLVVALFDKFSQYLPWKYFV